VALSRRALEDVLEVPVDLVTADDLPPRMRDKALAEAVPL